MSEGKMKIILGGKDDRIDVKSFLVIIRATIEVLDYISNEETTWSVGDVSRNTPINIEIEGESSDPLYSFVDSIKLLQDDGIRPTGFNDAVLDKFSRIATPLANGIDSIVYRVKGREPTSVSLRLTESIKNIKDPAHYFAYTELEGELGGLLVHGNKSEFYIFDPITDKKIVCKFHTEQAETVGSLITHRMRVKGNTKYSQSHEPLEIAVDDWEEIKNPATIGELHEAGFEITTGVSSEDIIRKIRELDGR